MSKAEELAKMIERYNSGVGSQRMCEDYLQCAAELRRLAALEKAIMDAEPEPVAWDVYVDEADNGYLVDSLDDPQLADDCTNHNAVVTPLYTLNGIKP